MNNFSVMIHIH